MIKYFLEKKEWDLTRATDGSSCYDLRADIGLSRDINPGERWLITTGLFLEMPFGIEAQVRSRSGLALHHGVIVLNAPGTIDSDYRGEVKVTLLNTDRSQIYVLHPGDRVAQLVFAQVMIFGGRSLSAESLMLERVSSRDLLSMTDRGDSGHGSTGR